MIQCYLGQFEYQRRCDVGLLILCLGAVKQARLAVMIREEFRAHAHFLRRIVALRVRRERGKAGLGRCARPCVLPSFSKAVWLVVGSADGDQRLHHPVALEVVQRTFRSVDRDLMEIGRAQSRFLRVEIGEQAALQQGIVRKVDAGNYVARQECDLFGLGEEIVDIAVERHAPHDLDRNVFLGDQLGGVEDIIGLPGRPFLIEYLYTQIPRRIIACIYCLEQIAPMEIRVGARDFNRLVPCGRRDAQHRFPVEFDELALALGIDEAEGVDAESLNHAQRPGDRAIRHCPHDHVHRFGHQPNEIPEGIVRRGCLWVAAVSLHLHAVHKVRKLHRILDEEHRYVVSYQVPIAALCVQLDGKPAYVARRVDRTCPTSHGGEAHEYRTGCASLLENRGFRQFRDCSGAFKNTVSARTARMNNALGDALMIKVKNLFAKDKILEQGGTSLSRSKAVLVVRNAMAEVVGQICQGIAAVAVSGNILMQFAAIAYDICRSTLPLTRCVIVEPVSLARRTIRMCHNSNSPDK